MQSVVLGLRLKFKTKMAELKTKLTTQKAEDFLSTIEPEDKKQDSFKLLEMMEEITGQKAQMWGTSIVGFGKYHYKSERSAQEGDWPLIGFSPRKQNLTLYMMTGFAEVQSLLEKLGKHKTSVGCLYLKKLADVDLEILSKLIKNSYEQMKKIHHVK